MGRLGRELESGDGSERFTTTVAVCDLDLGLAFDLAWAGGDGFSGAGGSGVGGAREPLRPVLDFMLSMLTLRKGSGSNGSITSLSSGRLGLCWLADFEGVKVTCGSDECVSLGLRSVISRLLMDGSSASAMVVSSSSGSPIRSLAVATTWLRISGGQRFHSPSRTSPLIIKHSTVVMERTVAVRRGAKAKLATSPKYCPCLSRGLM